MRLVTLYVYDDPVVRPFQPFRDLRDSIGTTLMIRRGKLDDRTEFTTGCGDSLVVRGYEHVARTTLPRPLVNPSDHRPSIDVGQRLSGQATRAESRGNDGNKILRHD